MASPLHIGILLYPNVTQLDATGPAQVLARVPGATLQATVTVKSVDLEKARAVLEIEGQEKPAYIAEPLTLCFV